MDPTVLRSVDATTVASVTALLGSAIALLAISGIGECMVLGSWRRPGGGGAQVIQLYLTWLPGARRSAPWAGSDKTVQRLVTAALVPAAFLSMVGVCANMASQATAALSASVRMASMVSAAGSPAPVTQSTVSGAVGNEVKGDQVWVWRPRENGKHQGGINVSEGLGQGLGRGQEQPGHPSLPSLALWGISLGT